MENLKCPSFYKHHALSGLQFKIDVLSWILIEDVVLLLRDNKGDWIAYFFFNEWEGDALFTKLFRVYHDFMVVMNNFIQQINKRNQAKNGSITLVRNQRNKLSWFFFKKTCWCFTTSILFLIINKSFKHTHEVNKFGYFSKIKSTIACLLNWIPLTTYSNLTFWKWVSLKMVGHTLVLSNKRISVEDSVENRVFLASLLPIISLTTYSSIKKNGETQRHLNEMTQISSNLTNVISLNSAFNIQQC